MEPINFAEVQKEIPEPTEFANAILSATNPDELAANISETQIFQESELSIEEVLPPLAMLGFLAPYGPREIESLGKMFQNDFEIKHMKDSAILDPDRLNTTEPKLDTRIFTFSESDPEVKGKLETFINRLVDETELFVRDLDQNEWFGLNPEFKIKLKEIFN